MCARYTLTATLRELRERFSLSAPDALDLTPRFNIAPTQSAAVIVDDGTRRLRLFRWGLIPSWAKDAAIGRKLINARKETVAEKPSFRAAFRSRRCLVPADGYYEWIGAAGARLPVRIVTRSRAPFAIAGLWESWKPGDGREIHTFTLLTAPAAPTVSAVHDRMPAILEPKDEALWLSPSANPEELARALSWTGAPLEHFRVSTTVNSPRQDTPACIEPLR